MGNFNYSANWGKNYDPSLFGEALNVYRNSGMFSAAPPAQAPEESVLGKALAEAKKYGVTLDSSSVGGIALAGALGPPKQPGYFEPGGDRQKLEDAMRMRREEADYAQKLGKESVWEAAKAKMILDLPGKLANAFNPYGSPQGALAYAAQLNNLSNVANDTMRSIPMMNVQSTPYNPPQQRYLA